jgi:hypothetical protein
MDFTTNYPLRVITKGENMPIQFTCTCGRKLQAKEEQAGKRLKCPACQKVLSVPASGEPKAPAQPVLAGKPSAALPPMPDVPAFPDEDDFASSPSSPAAPVGTAWVNRGFDQQSTPWLGNDRERLNKGMEYREVPDFLWIFLVLIVLGGLLGAAWVNVPANERKPKQITNSSSPATWVEGKITYKGTPLPSGVISFHDAQGKLFDVGIRADGSYEIDLDPGEYKVTVKTSEVKMPQMPNMKDMMKNMKGKGFDKGPQFKGPPQVKGPPQKKGPGKGPQKKGPGKAGPPKMQYVPPKYVPIPERYGNPETSGFTFEAKTGKQTFNIDLKE